MPILGLSRKSGGSALRKEKHAYEIDPNESGQHMTNPFRPAVWVQV